MSINPEFRFSQNNLQDYLDCPRRFELRYILRQAWPALESEPVLEQELRMVEGQQFHKLVQQFVVGLPVDELSESAETSANLAHWWNSFLQSAPLDGLPQKRLVEHYLSSLLGGYRLTAQYDLLAIEPGKSTRIFDWKTSSRKPNREFLKNRMQTRVYQYLLVAAGASLNDKQPLKPDQVEMVYWFPEHPTQPVSFSYDNKQYAADRTYLTNLIAEIAGREQGQFMLTLDEKKCKFCNYRSLCDRGDKAGDWNELEDIPTDETPPQNDLNFEQIGEIEF
jgi:RecB family exonuclease